VLGSTASIGERTIRKVFLGEESNKKGPTDKEVLMLTKRVLAAAVALTVSPLAAHAGENARCVDASVPKQTVVEHNGKWIELTQDQWEFLRGIYAMNPLTPPGLPFGDKAALATVAGKSGGMVFFLDGDRACTPMTVPDTLLSMMDDVATARISHEGSGL